MKGAKRKLQQGLQRWRRTCLILRLKPNNHFLIVNVFSPQILVDRLLNRNPVIARFLKACDMIWNILNSWEVYKFFFEKTFDRFLSGLKDQIALAISSACPSCRYCHPLKSKNYHILLSPRIRVKGLASHCLAKTIFTFPFSVINAFESIDNVKREMKSESGFS